MKYLLLPLFALFVSCGKINVECFDDSGKLTYKNTISTPALITTDKEDNNKRCILEDVE